MRKILVVDDDVSFNELLSKYLEKQGFVVVSALRPGGVSDILIRERPDLVLADYRLPETNGLELTKLIKESHPGLPVILMTNYADIRVAVNSIKLGAFEFVTKPVNPDELLKLVHLALSGRPQSEKPDHAIAPAYISGQNAQMRLLWQHLTAVAPTRMNVLITGESGTGKEHIARTLHHLSRRANKDFVAVDCGALGGDLAGSELFGYVKGAFTGAGADKAGLFEAANGGTLFLDEVGNLQYETQMLLLRAIQEGEIRRVGSAKVIQVDVRIVAATNEPLLQQVQQNVFRNDLYHRLNEFELSVPPLRERRDDLDEFCDFFVAQACRELEKPLLRLPNAVRDILHAYHWPGNLRELKNILKRAVLLSTGSEINPISLPTALHEAYQKPTIIESTSEVSSAASLNIKDQHRELEKKMISDALVKFRYNKSKTASELGIDRSTLYKKMKEYRLDP